MGFKKNTTKETLSQKEKTNKKTSTSHVKKTAWMFHNTSLKNLLNLSKGTKVPQHAWR